MNKFLETVMNFINENTTLLIIICVFLIFVLIGYLIDNSIKTKKMEKRIRLEENQNDENEPITSPVIEEPNIIEESNEVVEPITINEEVKEPEVTEEVSEINAVEPLAVPTVEDNEVKEEPSVVREIAVEPSVNDLLLRDFSDNNIDVTQAANIDNSLEETKELKDVTLNPIENIVSIEEIPETKIEEPKEESPYKNDKKLSDIFKKKEENVIEPNLEKTNDYSNELDRILQKLNSENQTSKDSTLEETQDFTNMF